ncbi:MAG: hypothetical protein OZ929_09015, partial [Bryobacterales bacterium]|nr:hypothetical protein [Bryobacterales bacterium]
MQSNTMEQEHFTGTDTIQRDRKKSDVCRALGFDLLRVTKCQLEAVFLGAISFNRWWSAGSLNMRACRPCRNWRWSGGRSAHAHTGPPQEQAPGPRTAGGLPGRARPPETNRSVSPRARTT